jgi:uncharacterized protein YqgC (DUF456 family)
MNILWALLLVLALAIGWLAQLVGLAGNWLMVVAAALYVWWIPPEATLAIEWPTVTVLLVLAILAEIAELAAGAMGVAKVGGSRRSAVLALVGSAVGGVVGLVVGLPIPLFGSLAAAVLFGGVGALTGAFLGESWKGRDFDTSFEVGKAAFIGRLLGTLAKMIISSVMVIVTLVALVL